jgi:hypothetical protein
MRASLLGVLVLVLVCGSWGCVARTGVPIESRPTPPQPEERAGAPVDSVVHEEPSGRRERDALHERAVADTLAARSAMARCAPIRRPPSTRPAICWPARAPRSSRTRWRGPCRWRDRPGNWPPP